MLLQSSWPTIDSKGTTTGFVSTRSSRKQCHAGEWNGAELWNSVRNNPALYRPFAWLQLFQRDALRYPVLLLLGQSVSGKTEFANSLFKKPLELKIGPLLHFPDKLRSFDRKMRDGIPMDFGTAHMKCHGPKGQHDDSHFVNMHPAIALLGGGFKYFLFSPLFGEDFQVD